MGSGRSTFGQNWITDRATVSTNICGNCSTRWEHLASSPPRSRSKEWSGLWESVGMTDQRDTPQGAGWDVVGAAAEVGSAQFGDRLRAIYALGSLAHGGFSSLVSDVDVAFILEDLNETDEQTVDDIMAVVRDSGLLLADRFSLFWGSSESLSGQAHGGRFPPLDRLDLIRHGILVGGTEARAGLQEPSYDDLVRGGACFALEVLSRPERCREITDAEYTVAGGPRKASKVALFPVRFLYTSRTGEIGENVAAVNHYLASSAHSRSRDLVEAAARWRTSWGVDEQRQAVSLLAEGAIPLYQEFADDYAHRLADDCLADELMSWARSLG
jgi:hypothetical protein